MCDGIGGARYHYARASETERLSGVVENELFELDTAAGAGRGDGAYLRAGGRNITQTQNMVRGVSISGEHPICGQREGGRNA
ncbi:MAG: hypothetical protein MUE42_06585 [Opitutaceae bacterium]|nr:hypothetical protein [Opitutaceae bacterium]